MTDEPEHGEPVEGIDAVPSLEPPERSGDDRPRTGLRERFVVTGLELTVFAASVFLVGALVGRWLP